MQFPHNCSECAAKIITEQFLVFFLVHFKAFHSRDIAEMSKSGEHSSDASLIWAFS